MPSFTNAETKIPQLFRAYLEAQRSNVGLPVAASLRIDAYQGALINLASGLASSDVITASSPHGLVVGDSFLFTSLTGGAGLTPVTATYYTQSVPSLTTLKASATNGGAAVNFTTDITAGEIRVVRELKRPYVGFSCAGFASPHPLLERITMDCELHVATGSTSPSDENAWVAAIRAALSDSAALSTWLNALSTAEKLGWRITGYTMREGAIEEDPKKKLRTRRAQLNIRCQADETNGF